MPFELYLCNDSSSKDVSADEYNYPVYDHFDYHDDANCHYTHGHNHNPYISSSTQHDHHHPHGVQFQIPQYILNGPPILAPGGGVEVLPVGLLDSPSSLASSWIANNGFAPFHSSLISRQGTSSSAQTSNSASTTPYHAFLPTGSQHQPADIVPHFDSHVVPQRQPLPEPPLSLEATLPYDSDLAPPSSAIPSAPSGSSSNASYSLSNALVPNPVPTPMSAPSSLGLPVYSISGVDVLSILSRVISRPNPTVELGPVDLSCSFVIVDVRRYDSPIVYASPTFYRLTGYSEREVLGRNCRFLQSPTGNVAKGEPRRFASSETVSHMRKQLSSSKECQTSLTNYRRGGHAFINLVTVIPLKGGIHNRPEEADEVVYHVGFQVDLTEQPNRILDKLRDGTYYTAWGSANLPNHLGQVGVKQGLGSCWRHLEQPQNVANIGLKGGRHGQMMSIAVSKELRNLIADKTFTDSISISTAANISSPNGASSSTSAQGGSSTTALTAFTTPSSGGTLSSGSSHRSVASGSSSAGPTSVPLSPSLSLMLLELLPDFLLVLSLKGAFLYVAPSVRLVLGYEPQELVGRSISDICHPADLVPLMRELKEGSVGGMGVLGGETGMATGSGGTLAPKPVDLLFRAIPKTSTPSPFSRTGEASASAEHCDSYHTPPSEPSTSPTSSSVSQSPPSNTTDTFIERSSGSSSYIWLECRGRLHVEPGKGRKAIILSGRARWMPVIRWATIGKAASAIGLRSRGTDGLPGSSMSSTPSDPPEFWAFVSLQGTILVASATVRDVLGWGVGELIGRSIWSMVRNSRGRVREHVEAELAKFEGPETDDPPPTIVTTSLVHKDAYPVQARLIFYRTPPSLTRPISTSTRQAGSTPHIPPRNNPLCPIVCQVVTIPSADYSSGKSVNTNDRTQSHADVGLDEDDDPDGPRYPPGVTLFEELDISRGSSWQYELQQLKFTNQRLQEELNALENATSAKTASGSSLGQSSSSSTVAAPPRPPIPAQRHRPQPPLHNTPLVRSTLPTSLSSHHPSNSLHDRAPPSSDWSSLAGANGQAPNPLKRPWDSENGPTT